MTDTPYTLALDYVEGFLLALATAKAGRDNRAAAASLASRPEDAVRFAGAISTMEQLADMHDALADRLLAAIGSTTTRAQLLEDETP